MTPRVGGRTSACGRPQAEVRRHQAEKFLEVAHLVAAESDAMPASASVSAALAVLAGITASDAACCASLGRRPRGQDHKQAVDLVRQVAPDGSDVAKKLDRLLDLKDSAHNGVIHLSGDDLKAALRNADWLVAFAQSTMRR
jgi:hypothetical protein